MITDIAAAVRTINEFLPTLGFEPRDADGNDFQRGADKDLRFKTGTSYGEVAIQIVHKGHANPRETIRILTDRQVEKAKVQIVDIVFNYDQSNRGLCLNPDCGQPAGHPSVCA